MVTSAIGRKPCLHGHAKETARLPAGLIYDSMLMKDVDERREVDGVCNVLKHIPAGPLGEREHTDTHTTFMLIERKKIEYWTWRI